MKALKNIEVGASQLTILYTVQYIANLYVTVLPLKIGFWKKGNMEGGGIFEVESLK